MKALRFFPLACFTLLLLLAPGNGAGANPGITIGIDVKATDNSCTGPAAAGDTCTLGTIEQCISVPNTPGYEFPVDIFVNNLTNGFTQSEDNLYFPEGVLIVQAVTYNAAVTLGSQKTGSNYTDFGETPLPDPPGDDGGAPYRQAGQENATAGIEDASWHRGGVARITFRVAAGAVPDVYGLVLEGPPLASYLDRQGTAYEVSVKLDANSSPQYGLVAVGMPCPTSLPVGGIFELWRDQSALSAAQSDSSAPNHLALAGAAVALVALTAGGWYARRRRLR